jgi:hypothetical protein
MNVATGEVLQDTKARHSSAEVLDFFKYLDRHVAESLDVHVVLDNLFAHKAAPMATWLAHPERARCNLHFHSDELVVAQPHREFVQPTHQPSFEEGNVLIGHAIEGRLRTLDRTLERRSPTVHLEKARRRDHCHGQARQSVIGLS